MGTLKRWLFGFTAYFEAENGVTYGFRVMPGWIQLGRKVWTKLSRHL